MPVTYLFPNGALAPTQAMMEKHFHAVHVQVLLADSEQSVDVVHNFQFAMLPPGPAVAPEGPLVTVNPISGGPKASLWTVAYKDGNTLTIGKTAVGPETSLNLDVWICRQKVMSTGLFG
jgi:hypothetical protein